MSGKRLLDVAAIFRASRGIASKYVALQRNQLDIYSKTSSLMKGVKNQTDRFTSTGRFPSAAAQTSSYTSIENARPQDTPMLSPGSINEKRRQKEQKSDLEQDQTETAAQSNSGSVPDIQQVKPKPNPLPDRSISSAEPDNDPSTHEDTTIGLQPASSNRTSDLDLHAKTKRLNPHYARELQRDAETQIPSVSADPPHAKPSESQPTRRDSGNNPATSQNQDVFYTPSRKASRVLSSLPRVKLPKTTGNTQQGDPHVPDEGINPDVFYSAASTEQQQQVPEVQAMPEQEQPSDAMYSDIFQSPRVAKLLKGEPKQGKFTEASDLRGVQDTPVEQAKSLQQKDQESFNVRPTGQKTSTVTGYDKMSKASNLSKGIDTEEIHRLAEDIAKDATSGSPANSEVSS